MKALSTDRDERFQDSKQFQTALLEFMYPSTPDLVRDSMQGVMSLSVPLLVDLGVGSNWAEAH